MAWTLDGPALDQVLGTLSLRLPVRIVKHSGGARLLGTHQLRSAAEAPGPAPVLTRYYHHITVGAKLTPRQASRTIWHECAHARQAESEMHLSDHKFDTLRAAQAFWRETESHPDYSDADIPYEVAARKYEDYAEFIAPCV